MTDHSLLVRIRRFFHLPENEPEIAWTRTPLYRRRLEQVKTGWIITALLMWRGAFTTSIETFGRPFSLSTCTDADINA